MKKIGRPEKTINWELFEELCNIQCTHDELASMCKVSKATLYERAEKHYEEDFPTIYKRFSESGKCSLRRSQFKMSAKNTSMAIWLGKQYLSQKDTQDYVTVTPQTVEHFQSLMKQISDLQASSLKKAESNSNSEEKS